MLSHSKFELFILRTHGKPSILFHTWDILRVVRFVWLDSLTSTLAERFYDLRLPKSSNQVAPSWHFRRSSGLTWNLFARMPCLSLRCLKAANSYLHFELMPALSFHQQAGSDHVVEPLLRGLESQPVEEVDTSMQPNQECEKMQSVSSNFGVWLLVQRGVVRRNVFSKSST